MVNGRYNGQGEYGNKQGVVFQGIFKDDILQKGLVKYCNFIPQNTKYLEYMGGVRFDPVSKQYLRHCEKGQLSYANGDVYQG